MKKFNWKIVLHLAASVFLIFLAIHYWPGVSEFIKKIFSAASPLIIGFIMAYPLSILMKFYMRHFFPKSDKKAVKALRKPVSLISAIITITAIIALILVLILPQLTECVKLLVTEIPYAINTIIEKLSSYEFIPDDLIESLSSIDWKSRITDVAKKLVEGFGDVMNVAVTAVTSVFSIVSNIVIGIIFSIYLLAEKENLQAQGKRVAKHFIPEKAYKKIAHVFHVTNDCFHRFIVGQCTEAVILGTLCTIGMLIFKLPYAPMIGALMGFTSLIPIFGGLIGAGVSTFLILMESPMKALIFLIFIIILQQFEGNVIYPKVVGSTIGMPGIWVLAAVTIGAGVMGITGMIIGVPLFATCYKLINERIDKAEAEELDIKTQAEAEKSN